MLVRYRQQAMAAAAGAEGSHMGILQDMGFSQKLCAEALRCEGPRCPIHSAAAHHSAGTHRNSRQSAERGRQMDSTSRDHEQASRRPARARDGVAAVAGSIGGRRAGRGRRVPRLHLLRRGRSGPPAGVVHSTSVFYGGFLCVGTMLNCSARRISARAEEVIAMLTGMGFSRRVVHSVNDARGP